MTGLARGSVRWIEFADAGELATAVAEQILDAARHAIAARGTFRLVVAGGRTPLAAYARLAGAESPWKQWQVYFSDERCRPHRDPDRNDTVICQAWLDRVPIPADQVHSIPAELGPDEAARACAQQLAGVPDFDLVLLGLGEDGHTASLFPGQPVGDAPDSPDALPVHRAPKPPAERVSLSAARLSRSRRILFVVSGESKRDAVRSWRAGQELPARHVMAGSGVEVLLDRAAAGGA